MLAKNLILLFSERPKNPLDLVDKQKLYYHLIHAQFDYSADNLQHLLAAYSFFSASGSLIKVIDPASLSSEMYLFLSKWPKARLKADLEMPK